MKKSVLCIVVILLLLAPLAFAQDAPPPPSQNSEDAAGNSSTYLSFSLPFPVTWEFFTAAQDGGVTKEWTWGWSVGVDLTSLFTRRFGIHLSADFCFPQLTTSFYEDGSELTNFNVTAFGASVFAGPAIALVRTPRVLFVVSPGVHAAVLCNVTSNTPTARFLFGLGGSAQVAVDITRSFFISGGLDVVCDFIGVERHSNLQFEKINSVLVNFAPAIGAGFKL